MVAYSINAIAIYDSPQCEALVNYDYYTRLLTLSTTQMNVYARLYKLVAYDAGLASSSYASYKSALNNAVKANLTNPYMVILC